jgi:hypothetical protein
MSASPRAELEANLELFASLSMLMGSTTGQERADLLRLRNKVRENIIDRFQAACADPSGESQK